MQLKIKTLSLVGALMCLLVMNNAFAQDPNKIHSVGLYQVFTDYNVQLLNNKPTAFDSALSQSVRVAYQRRLSRTWMLNTGLSNGFILNQIIQESFEKKAWAIGIDASLILKFNNGRILKENPRIAPFLSFGYRTDYIPKLKKLEQRPWLFHNQYGVGVNVKLTERSHIQLQAALDQKLEGDFNTHVQYRLGVTQSVGKYESSLPSQKPKMDSDGDGIVDALDKCPTEYGTKKDGGCPDNSALVQEKIEKDSLLYRLSEKQREIEALELTNAELRSRDKAVDNSVDAIVFKEENEQLQAQIASLRETNKEIEASYKQKLITAQNKPAVVQVDTVFSEKIVYQSIETEADDSDEILVFKEENEQLQAQIAGLRETNKEIEASYKQKLITAQNKPVVVQVDTVFSEKIVYQNVETVVDNSEELNQLKDENNKLQDVIASQKRVLEENVLLALNNEQEAMQAKEREQEAIRARERALEQEERLRIENEARIARLEAENARIAREEAEKARRIAESRKKQESTNSYTGSGTRTNTTKSSTYYMNDKNYYVVTMSSPNLSTAENWLNKMIVDFPTATILPQPNGYYRVGVSAAKDKQLGLELLQKVKSFGYNPAWLSLE